MYFVTLHVSWQPCDWAIQHFYERRGDLNPSQNRPALAQQPSVYLEPKWLRYLMRLHISRMGMVMRTAGGGGESINLVSH